MKTKRIAMIAAVLYAAVLLCSRSLSASGASDVPAWPEHHGPGRTNISPEKNLLKKWPEGGPRRAW
ncbi:MAG: hypothetical protein ACYTE3_26005 [Planctomycetota bacterium]|jgi:hypothetical protein